MSVTFPQYPNTTFPDVIQTFDTYVNITQDDVERYEAAQRAMLSGNLTMAQNMLNSIPNIKQKALTSEKLNTLIDTVQALEEVFSNEGFENTLTTYQNNWKAYINQFQYIGDWNNTTNYVKNNMVSYISTVPNTDETKYLYIAMVDQPSSQAVNPYQNYEDTFAQGEQGVWYRITIRGKAGESGASASSVSFRYGWNDTTNYIINDIVVSDNGWWVALQPNVNSKPSITNPDWELIIEMTGGVAQYPVQAEQPTNQEIGDLWFQIVG